MLTPPHICARSSSMHVMSATSPGASQALGVALAIHTVCELGSSKHSIHFRYTGVVTTPACTGMRVKGWVCLCGQCWNMEAGRRGDPIDTYTLIPSPSPSPKPAPTSIPTSTSIMAHTISNQNHHSQRRKQWRPHRGPGASPRAWSRCHGCMCAPTSRRNGAKTAPPCRAEAARNPSHRRCTSSACGCNPDSQSSQT